MSETAFPTIVFERRVVPNLQPILSPDSYRIAVIGEAPGETEENYRTPFVGKSGELLNGILKDEGIDRNKILLANVCQVRPPGNDITRFDWEGKEIKEGLAKLREDIEIFNPNICLLLGNTPLHAAKYGSTPPRRAPKGGLNYSCKIGDWCGSLFLPTDPSSPFTGRKCIAGFHPSGILRFWGTDGNYPRLKHAIHRARGEGDTQYLQLPQRELLTNLSVAEVCHILDTWPVGHRCSLDIEGGLPIEAVNLKKVLKQSKQKKEERRPFGWPCVSVSGRPTKSFTIVWSRYPEAEVWKVVQAFARLMWRKDVPKVLQNQLYDNFVLSFGYGIMIRNVREDIMIKGWCIYAELPRSLSVQGTIYTREPHWKDNSMYGSIGEGLYHGCAIDSAVTLEICEAQDSQLSGRRLEHYRKTLEIQNPFLYMEMRGIKYDRANVSHMLKETEEKMIPVRKRLQDFAGYDLCGATSISSQKLMKCLYDEKGYEPQFKKDENDGKGKKLTSDIEAILNLKKKNQADPFLADVALHRHLEGIRETLQIEADSDGRVRCGYSLEAETGRVKCYTSPTGSGANLQTIQKALRANYIADEGYEFGQADLEGADGWTVAARCAKLGDPTMLLDYQAGMKPAKIIALMYWFGREINSLDRASLKFHHDRMFPIVKKEVGEWLYLGCKRVQHGSSYLMGIPTMQLNVLKDSFKESGVPIYMEFGDARRLQTDCLFARYNGIPLWHTWAESTVRSTGELQCASGHTRIFFGRRYGLNIKDTVKEFLAHEPQNNTTWATNLAMLNLWNDPANRVVWVDKKKFLFKTGDGETRYWSGPINAWSRIWPGSLLIEPLHQVHDALCCQWPIFLREWARKKISTYFQNILTIADTKLTIPFDGTFGPSWYNMPNKI